MFEAPLSDDPWEATRYTKVCALGYETAWKHFAWGSPSGPLCEDFLYRAYSNGLGPPVADATLQYLLSLLLDV